MAYRNLNLVCARVGVGDWLLSVSNASRKRPHASVNPEKKSYGGKLGLSDRQVHHRAIARNTLSPQHVFE